MKIEYVIRSRGTLIWIDSMVIPKAPHPDNAHAFIDFMQRAGDRGAQPDHVNYANANKDPQPKISKEVIEDPAHPDAATLARLQVTTPYDPKLQRVITRQWADLKSAE